jgi:acyl carrier protein
MTSPDQHRIESLIADVLQRMNAFLPSAEQIPSTPDTVLIGDGGHLDSLGIANFIISVEESVEQELGRELPLSDQDLTEIFGPSSVTVRSFAAYLLQRLQA